MENQRNPHTAIEAIKQMMLLFRGEWHDIGVVIIYAIGVGLCSLAFPIAVQSLVNTVAFATLLQPLVILTILVGGVLVFAGIMRVMQLFSVEYIQRRLVTRLGLTLAGRIPHIQQERFLKKYGPEYVLRFLEVFQAQKALAVLLLDGIAIFFQIAIGFTLVAFYHPLFFAFALILLIAIGLILGIFGWGGVRTSVDESEAKYEVVSWLQDLASNATVFKSFGGEQYATERADSLISSYLHRRSQHFSVLIRQVIASLLLQAAGSSLLLGLGGYLVINGQLTLGQLVAAELVFSIILLGISKMGKHLEVFYDLAAGIKKIEAIFELPYEELSGSQIGLRDTPAQLRFEQVTATTPYSIQPIISKASFSVAAGEKIAIWGANGSGKSFLANLIYRLSEPQSGIIRLDEFNITTIHPNELRNQITLIRDIELFHGSIKDNIIIGRKDISENEIRRALQIAGLLEDVYALQNGINTVLRGTPTPLSRSQALRLMVARGILQQRRLLVLDGTLDFVDEEARRSVLSALLSKEVATSLVVLTHEHDILKSFPRVLKLENGAFQEVVK